MMLFSFLQTSKFKTLEVEDENKKKVTVSNPAYEAWLAQDQVVLGYLTKSMNQEILARIFDHEHVTEVWATVESILLSQSRAKVNMLRGALSNTKKLDMTSDKFIAKMKSFVSELAVASKIFDDNELKG
jgi:hypothetical protein